MPFIAARMDRFQPTASSVATQRARELAAEGRDIIRLAQGEPDFPTPENVKRAAVRAMERNETGYTPTAGTVAMKEAIAEKFRRDNGLDYSPEQIIAGTGGKQVIFSAIVATVEPGEEVIIPAPYFVAYPDVVSFARGVPVVVECAEEHGFKLQPDELEAAITERTKWLILNSPNNPSGSAYTESELAALAIVLLDHTQVHVMTDDIYEHILFDGRPFHTMAAVEPALFDRTLTVNGVSKAYSMTGWRLGFAGGPAELIRSMTKLQNQNTGNPCSITQAAAIEALTGPQSIVGERTAEFQQRRDVVVELLNEAAGLTCRSPEGAFYVYPNCSALIGRRTPSGKAMENDKDVVVYLMEDGGVAGVHGEAFGLSPYFRLSTAAGMEELKEACVRVQAACQVLS